MNKANKKIINSIIKNNNPDYQLIKVLEELSELQTALLQYITKKDKTTKQNVIDEIGDVEIRMEILKNIFGKIQVKKRINFKLGKFAQYIKEKKFSGQI